MYTLTQNLSDACPTSQRIYSDLQFDYLVPTSDLEENKFNHQLYKNFKNKKNQEYIQQLSQQIDEQGLQRTPIVFADELLLIGGHHRKRALQLLGVSHIPVRHNDKGHTWKEFKNKPASIMVIMASDNQRPPENEFDKHCALVAFLEAHKVEFGCEPSMKDIQSYGATAGFSYKKWCLYKKLIGGGTYVHPSTKEVINLPPRPELWKDIEKGEKSLAWACKTQKNDAARKIGIIRPKCDEHDNLLTSEVCSEMMECMGRDVKAALEEEVEVYGKMIQPFIDADKTLKSAMCSGYIEEVVAEGMRTILGIDAHKNGKGAHFDVTADAQPLTFNLPFDLEVKHTFEKYWTSGTEKIGYHLLCQTNETYDEFCVLYVYVPEFTWSLGGHGPKKLPINSLKGLDVKVLHGELYEDEKGNMKTKLQGVK